MECKNCIYWTDFKNRVFARISDFSGNMSRGRIELRPCKHIPSPNISDVFYTYTDENFGCSDGEGIKK